MSTDTRTTNTHAVDNEKKREKKNVYIYKKGEKEKQQEILSLWEEGKLKLNSSSNSCLCSGSEQHKKSAANRPNYFSILPMAEDSIVVSHCARMSVRGFYL